MQQQFELTPKPKAKGIPWWLAMLALLVLAMVIIGTLVFFSYRSTNEKARLERQAEAWKLEQAKVEIDRQKAQEQAKLAIALTRQTDALSQIRVATNACGQLLLNLTELEGEAATLRSSDAGRRVARFPDLVAMAKRFYEVDMRDLPAQSVVISKLEGERLLEHQLMAASGTTFEPDAAVTSAVQTDMRWINQESQKVQVARALVARLIEAAKFKVPPADSTVVSLTLDGAIAQLTRLQAAKLKADQVSEDAKAKADKQEREQLVRNAERKVAAEQAADEALKVQLRAKAKDPKLQAKLAPFTTPGYVQFGSDSYDKAPLSYSGLMQYGALSQSKTGLQKLATVAKLREDKVRPRWHFRIDQPNGWDKTTSDREMVMEAQQLLIELGPTLVEMGMLQK